MCYNTQYQHELHVIIGFLYFCDTSYLCYVVTNSFQLDQLHPDDLQLDVDDDAYSPDQPEQCITTTPLMPESGQTSLCTDNHSSTPYPSAIHSYHSDHVGCNNGNNIRMDTMGTTHAQSELFPSPPADVMEYSSLCHDCLNQEDIPEIEA